MFTFILGLILGSYLSGFGIVFASEIRVGPVTLALAFMRAVVWPYYLLTGEPKGERF